MSARESPVRFGAVAEEAAEVLSFWIGPLDSDGAPEPHRVQLWFGSDPAFDAEVRRRFSALCRQALAGEREHWRGHPGDWLALLIVLDQFPRNIHRESGEAYGADALAQAVALEGLSRRFDAAVPVGARGFCYLPFQHAEDRVLQQRSVELYEALLEQAPDALRGFCSEQLRYARAHRDLIARFGRFPHRNAVLGRQDTAQERAFLDTHGRGF